MPHHASAGVWARSWFFTTAIVVWTTAASIAFLPALVRRPWTIAAIRLWISGIMILARTIAGVTYRIEGRENLPAGPCIIAAQHQSAFETYLLFTLLDRPVFILKRELARLPIIGWYIKRAGLVDIDRSSGGAALRKTLHSTQAALARGEQVVIFPEGTTVPPGTRRPYRSGIAALYLQCDAPVIPVALNSDYCWGKIRVLKRPGEITLRFLPALPRGLDRDEVLDVLRQRIEAAARLMPGWREIPSPSEQPAKVEATHLRKMADREDVPGHQDFKHLRWHPSTSAIFEIKSDFLRLANQTGLKNGAEAFACKLLKPAVDQDDLYSETRFFRVNCPSRNCPNGRIEKSKRRFECIRERKSTTAGERCQP